MLFLLFLFHQCVICEDCSSYTDCLSCIGDSKCGWYAPAEAHFETFTCVEGGEFNCNQPECKDPHLYYHDYCPVEKFEDIVTKRRSIRKYLDIQIDKKVIEEIIVQANWAPSCIDCIVEFLFIQSNIFLVEPWKWYVVQEKSILKNISDAAGVGYDIFYGAPSAVFLFVDPKSPCKLYQDVDAGLALMNFELTAYNFGLSTCSLGAVKMEGHVEETIIEIMKPHRGYSLVIGIALGHANETAQHDRKSPSIVYV